MGGVSRPVSTGVTIPVDRLSPSHIMDKDGGKGGKGFKKSPIIGNGGGLELFKKVFLDGNDFLRKVMERGLGGGTGPTSSTVP